MIDVQYLREIFCEKLKATGDMDRAFVKAVWVAYQQGLADATKACHPFNFDMNSLKKALASEKVMLPASINTAEQFEAWFDEEGL